MTTGYSAALNGVSPEEFGEHVVITDICEEAPQQQTGAMTCGGGDGQWVLRQYRRSLTVRIVFTVEDYDTAARKAVVSRIAAWAMQGGWLTISDRPDQRLSVICQTPPTVTSSMRWLDKLQVVFIACAMPYWIGDTESTRITLSADRESTGTITAHGNAGRAYVEAVVTAGAAPVTWLRITVGGRSFKLTGFSLPAGQKLIIGYNAMWLLYMQADGVNVHGCRTADSDDDLIIGTGSPAAYNVKTDTASTVELRTRGLWL